MLARPLLPLVSLSLISACGQPSDLPTAVSPQTSPESVIASVVTPELRNHIEAQLQTYVNALQTANSTGLLAVISKELGHRIATRGPEGGADAKVTRFLERENNKLVRELGLTALITSTRHPISVKLTSLQLEAEGTFAVAAVALNGQHIPKAIYLIREGESYRVNIVPPTEDILATTSYYRVQNDDPVIRTFSCSGSGPYSIGVKPSQRQSLCQDSCRFWWFDGTTFEAQGSYTDCDYNTWGVDMYVRGGNPVCSDPC